MHLPLRRPPGRPAPQRPARLVLGRPRRRSRHRRHRGQGGPRRLAGQGMLRPGGRRGRDGLPLTRDPAIRTKVKSVQIHPFGSASIGPSQTSHHRAAPICGRISGAFGAFS
ncbi:Exonuclease SbcC [Streptomyces sp. KY75]|nr:Exonuclease SbcC [Streptomyces sp. KY75]CAD5973201.1 Exonuclease SbcC [Streptomyces sp. KY70]